MEKDQLIKFGKHLKITSKNGKNYISSHDFFAEEVLN